jgi:hypothetical protein
VDVTGAVTAGAAGLAAILAGVNLYVSGRREVHKWTHEALVEALVIFLDTSSRAPDGTNSVPALIPSGPNMKWFRNPILHYS